MDKATANRLDKEGRQRARGDTYLGVALPLPFSTWQEMAEALRSTRPDLADTLEKRLDNTG